MNVSWNIQELSAMIIYFAVVLGVGIYFFVRDKKTDSCGEKGYFLGGRQMNGWVAAFSAGASDMSAWVLMGLPGSIYLYGIGKIWISVGLLIGTVCSWLFVAPRLRRYSILADDSITVPQFLTNRFRTGRKELQVVSAVVFMVAYCIYSASSLVACGKLFHTVLGVDPSQAMIVSALVIVCYTFLGGFNAVCWTDFFQGLLMLGALMLAPVVAVLLMISPDFIHPVGAVPSADFFNPLSGGGFTWSGIAVILSGLGWGLGYFGMPHILVRYLSIRSEREMNKSRVIGSVWTLVILIMASFVGIIGRYYLGESINTSSELVFVSIVRSVFPLFLGGILLSAVLAAAMSTADSQLLASASAFASDMYKPLLRRGASDKEMLWIGRAVVALICAVAYLIASSPKCGGIMALVECAWGAFGSAFGPVILLALYWRRLTYSGAVAGVAVGFLTDAAWYLWMSHTGLYEIVPGFICGLIAAVAVSLCCRRPDDAVTGLFERSRRPADETGKSV